MENKMDRLDVIQTLTEVASLSVSVNKMYTQLQLSRSAIQTVIHELEEEQTGERDWLITYLYGVLENLK
jgi:hypothetical protein